MKVSELIEKLKGVNKDLHVYVPRFADDSFPEFQLATKVEQDDFASLHDDRSDIFVLTIE